MISSEPHDLVLRYGWNSTCYQILNPGIRHWISKNGNGLVGYVEFAGFRVVAGSPVSEEQDLPLTVKEFEAASRLAGCKVCYFAAEARFELYAQPRPEYSFLLLGAQPVWSPRELVRKIEAKASLRTQLNRSRNKGVKIEEWSAVKATNNVELRRVVAEWLSQQGLPSLHFLVEPDTLSNLADRRIFVATLRGEVVGFLNASPIPLRNGWLVEQFVRSTNAPNGTIELLLYDLAVALAGEGAEYLTLGLSPLSKYGGTQPKDASLLIRGLLYWARAHGKRFYNFEGLEFFKSKFEPDNWEPIYAVTNERHFSLRALFAIACAFTNGHPIRSVLAGIDKAVWQEIKWIKGKG